MKNPKSYLEKLYSGDNSLKLLDQSYLPRWMVVIIDTLLSVFSLYLVYIILLGTPINFREIISVELQGIIVLGITLLSFFAIKTYSGIIRHSTFIDILKLLFSSFVIATILFLINFVYSFQNEGKIFITTGILLYMLISFSVLLLFRLMVKESYQLLKHTASTQYKKRVLIYGIDDHSLNVGKTILEDGSLNFNLIGFASEEYKTSKGKVSGKPILTINNNFEDIVKQRRIEAIIIAERAFSIKEKNKIVELCLTNKIEVFNAPSLEQLNASNGIQIQIKPVQIEDLLERDPIEINNDLIKLDLENKTILVTGGAGSIGSEIINQISSFKPKLLIILDQAESALHELEINLLSKKPNLNFSIELASISNSYRLEKIFSKYDIEYVFHAAAYKHVPLIEKNPHEAIFVNVSGTVNLATLSIKFGIKKFVMISTDKAVNPTNVMGASKRVAEMFVQSLQNENPNTTKFITTRFGNVLGSNGSVIPHFRNQITKGGPVTVTHKEIIRYFMTIPEACQLVLQAGTMGQGGEIFVFDMGKQVKILDLAEKMIKLSGLKPYEDIDIEITGLRPGEKLFEELVSDSSKSLPTHHKKIMVSTVPIVDFNEIKYQIDNLIISANFDNEIETVYLLKKLVPEFKSENSVFEELDQLK
ncbi:MAG: nucleoside-diphosphate sugar epimerase/dehydratase [Flavobacteriaceae bacterium]